MTFEEFFLKKKIDLKSLAQLKPALFQEFKNHYEQMGEKSFDHTKKYWFNALRKDFKLSEENELVLKELLYPTKVEVQVIPLKNIVSETSSNPVQGFKPIFRASPIPVKLDENIEESKTEEKLKKEVGKPVGFKPRFKASTTPTNQEEKVDETKSEEKPKEETTKPIGFKPRFKAVITPIKKSED
jgi:hypothetical protein